MMVLAACRLSSSQCSANAFMEADPLTIFPVSELDIIWLHWRVVSSLLCYITSSPSYVFDIFYFFVREQDLSSFAVSLFVQ